MARRELRNLEKSFLDDVKHASEEEDESEEEKNLVGRLAPSVFVEELARLLDGSAGVEELLVCTLNGRRRLHERVQRCRALLRGVRQVLRYRQHPLRHAFLL